MIYLSFIPLVLVLYQHASIVKCGYVNISLSATNVRVSGHLQITLINMNPACCADFRSLYLSYLRFDGSTSHLATYDSRLKRFLPVSVMPAAYQGRLLFSAHDITIFPVSFDDERTKYFMLYSYYVGVSTHFFESRRLELLNVYDLPVFVSSLQTVNTAVEGIQKLITCMVKSRPASNITWSHDVGVAGTATQNVIQNGYYFITTGTFTVEKPLYSMRGKKIFCIGETKFGAPIKQSTTLNVLYRPRNTVLTVTPSKLALNTNIQLSCNADGMPSTRNYRFYVNGKLIGNKTDGKLTVNVLPSNCVNYTGEYKCVPESTIGDGEMKVETREFDSHVTLNVSKTVNEGQEVTLYCSAKDCPTSDITWKKGGVSIGGRMGEKLQFVSVTKNDAGEYSCHATFWKTTKSATMTLTVNYYPDNIQFTAPTLKPKNGNAVTLFCSSNGIPTPAYRIYKITGSSSTFVASSNSHSIAKINYADYTGYKATFRCESKNFLGNITKDIQLDIQVEPLLSLTVTPNIIMENQSAMIECKVTAANPPATAILRDSKNSFVPLVNGATTLTSVKRERNGLYSCTAANSAHPSPKTKTASLIVQYKPDAVTFRSSSLTPINGSQVTLTCTSNGVPAPSYKIESITGTNTKILHDTTSGTYSIGQINYADFFKYRVTIRCTARNTIGAALNKEVELNIQVRPILVISSNQKVEEDTKAVFSCNVTASNPSASITWRDSSNRMISHINGMVIISHVSVKQAGKYSCHAKNAAGESMKIFTLDVKRKVSSAKIESRFEKCTYGVIALSLLLMIIVVAFALFLLKRRTEIRNLKAEIETLRNEINTNHYMGLSPRGADNDEQHYQPLTTVQGIASCNARKNADSTYMELNPHHITSTEQNYAKLITSNQYANTSI